MTIRGLNTKTDEEFDREAEQQSEARVVNVSPNTVRFEIGTTPGSPSRKYRLRSGESINIELGYTKDFTGAGRRQVRATIESLTERAAYPGGPLLPQVVHEEKAEEAAEAWAAAIARGKEAQHADVLIPTTDGREPIKMRVQTRAAVIEDVEDQGGEPLDEPPPDHNDPLPVVTAPKGKGDKSK